MVLLNLVDSWMIDNLTFPRFFSLDPISLLLHVPLNLWAPNKGHLDVRCYEGLELIQQGLTALHVEVNWNSWCRCCWWAETTPACLPPSIPLMRPWHLTWHSTNRSSAHSQTPQTSHSRIWANAHTLDIRSLLRNCPSRSSEAGSKSMSSDACSASGRVRQVSALNGTTSRFVFRLSSSSPSETIVKLLLRRSPKQWDAMRAYESNGVTMDWRSRFLRSFLPLIHSDWMFGMKLVPAEVSDAQLVIHGLYHLTVLVEPLWQVMN